MVKENTPFAIGFWQYYEFGRYGAAESAKEWQDMYANIAYSYRLKKGENPEKMTELLNECEKKGMKLIVVDDRLGWNELASRGEEEYKKGVKACVERFAAHPACFAFMTGDEPTGRQFPQAKRAVQIIQSYTDKPAFVNFYPSWFGEEFDSSMQIKGEEYEKALDDFIKESGLKLLAYDCYSQMSVRNEESGVNNYFRNLNLFRRLAQKNGIPCWTSLLCVEHWQFRLPSKTDLRWQLSTAIASGMKGAQWFELYEMNHEDYWEGYPKNKYGELSEQWRLLRDVNRELTEKPLFPLLPYLRFIDTHHLGAVYGDSYYYFDGCDKNVAHFSALCGGDAILTHFEDVRDGADVYMAVNNSVRQKDYFSLEFKGENSVFNKKMWLVPGGFFSVKLKKEKGAEKR